MKERPILFSGPMVRAILEGRKTQTRRVMKRQPSIVHYERGGVPPNVKTSFACWDNVQGEKYYLSCPYGVPGDRLWVRESMFGKLESSNFYYSADRKGVGNDIYFKLVKHGWKLKKSIPSIHMPRWASRLTLEIESVRVERLQDISEEDARAEGARFLAPELDEPLESGGKLCGASYRYGFECLWESINGKGSWNLNPWVWVINFERASEECGE